MACYDGMSPGSMETTFHIVGRVSAMPLLGIGARNQNIIAREGTKKNNNNLFVMAN